MPLVTVTLAFALLSLGFAPAPFPKAERPEVPRQRELRECERELRRLGVATWAVESRDGKDHVRFETWGQHGMHDLVGHYPVQSGDLPRTLRALARFLQREIDQPK